MAIIKSYVSEVTGRGNHLFADKAEFLFQGEGINDIAVDPDDSDKSRFYYNLNVVDDRAGKVYVRCNYSVADLTARIEVPSPNKFITLTVYTQENSAAPTEDRTFRSDAICLGYDVAAGAIVYVRQGVVLERIMVTESIADILVEAGHTTTTTSTTTELLSDYTVWDAYYTTSGGLVTSVVIKFTDDGDTYPTGAADPLNASSTPPTTAFSFTGMTPTPNISGITFVETYTGLRLAIDNSPTASSPTVSYTRGTPPLQDASGLDIDDFSNQSIRVDN